MHGRCYAEGRLLPPSLGLAPLAQPLLDRL